ncbi:MAG: hypothetical protein GXZ06_04700 [Tissierellia bacterium]|nr:hypothetical protein [Tissierellia bacterium]
MEERYVVVTDDKFSEPMSKEEAIKMVKSYDSQNIIAYIISEEEAKRIRIYNKCWGA